MTPLLHVRELSVRFGTGAPVVRDIDLELEAGRCLALVGESGSGKSVVARTLIGLAGENAEVRADDLRFDGIDLRALPARQWRNIRGRRIGFVLQDALTSLDPLRRVGHEVAEPLQIHRLAKSFELDDAVIDLLAAVGIPDPDDRSLQYPHELSGGLRQRVLIASAIAGRPELIIADEPTTALDVRVQAQILRLLDDRRALGSAVLLISHDLAVVAGSADEVAVLYAGVVVERGSTAEIFTAPAHPYTVELLAAAPRGDGSAELPALVPWARPAVSGCPFATRCPLVEERCRVALPEFTEVRTGHTARCLHPGEHRARIRGPAPAEPVSDGPPLLEFRSVSHQYRGARRSTVKDISFTLARGETLGVVGESGSGKSTIARLTLAHLTPHSGTVEFGGEPWSARTERARRPLRRRIQLIDQDPLSAFDPRWNVERIVAEALSREREPSPHVAQLLMTVGLDPEVRHRRPAQLSGGQRQRVAIARALAAEPELIVADEPVSALDVTIQSQILEVFDRLRRETGTAVLFISHDLAVVRRLCTRLLVIHDGQIVESGPTEDVFAAPQHPYTRQLLAAIPRAAVPISLPKGSL